MINAYIDIRFSSRIYRLVERPSARLFALILFVFLGFCFDSASADDRLSSQLLDAHDFKTTTALGVYFLKQESRVSVRAYLKQVGKERQLGPKWNSSSAWWRQAEEALVELVEPESIDAFKSTRWLKDEWNRMLSENFESREIEQILSHFSTEIGAKQAKVINHSISKQVMMSLTFSGKLKQNVAGAEDDLDYMRELYSEEEKAMRFATSELDGVAAQTFALSSIGKRYFTTLIISLTGRINEKLDDMVERIHVSTDIHKEAIEPYVSGFLANG
ncbi:MAG: hypothetical protein VW645_05725 [Betaproteobacteria bacterium]